MMLVSYMKVAWVLCAILLLPATPWASEEKKFASVACSDTVLLRVSRRRIQAGEYRRRRGAQRDATRLGRWIRRGRDAFLLA